MKILHIDSEKGWSGGQSQVEALIHHLRQWGYKNGIICPERSVLARRCRSDGYEVFGVRMRNSMDFLSIIRLAKIMKAYAPDVVHMHASKAHFLGAWAVWLAGSSCVVVVTRRMDYKLRRALLMRFYYSRLVDRVVAISSGVKRSLESSGIQPKYIEVIHDGVDLRLFDLKHDGASIRENLGIPVEARVMGVIAALIERKGHKYLLMAMPKVLRKFPDAILLVIGDGPKRRELESIVSRIGIARHIIFTGWIQRISEVLAAMDLLLLPSLAEGLGVSLIEGMAMGLPVIGTTAGGIPDMIHDQVNGFLVPPRDPDAIAKRALQLLRDPELSARMGRAGRTLVQEEFSSSIMARRNEALYLRLLANKGRGRKSPT